MRKVFVLIGIVCCCLMFFSSHAMAAEERWEEGKKQAEALKDGEVIDQSNWQKVSYLLPEAPLNWVKQGWWILTIGDMGYPWVGEGKMWRLTDKNAGKFDVDSDGWLIDKATGEPPVYFEGLPFPKSDLDPNDPNMGMKIVYNFHFRMYWWGTMSNIFDFAWVGHDAFERQMFGLFDRLYYYNRYQGQNPNPHEVASKSLIVVLSPYDVQGLTTLRYTAMKGDDDLWTYVPALRRIRRLSPANTSDAFVGSDFCNDDASLYAGKVATFDWTFLHREMSMTPESGKPAALVWNEKYKAWMMPFDAPQAYYGYETPGYKGRPWTQAGGTVYNPVPVYVVKGIPKDKYYNYGRNDLAVSQDVFNGLYKLIYDRAGEYWKTVYSGSKGYYVEGQEDLFNSMLSSAIWVFDERSKHGSICHTGDFGFGSDYEILFAPPFSTEMHFTQKEMLKYGK